MRSRPAAPILAALLLCALPGGARAERIPENLKAFKSVCINAGFEEQDKENEAIRTKLINRMYSALAAVKVAVADAPCQAKGLTGAGQLNLYFDFATTKDGLTFSGQLEGWLTQEGTYKSPTLWSDSIFGALDKGGGALEAADVLNELMDGFLADWKKGHGG